VDTYHNLKRPSFFFQAIHIQTWFGITTGYPRFGLTSDMRIKMRPWSGKFVDDQPNLDAAGANNLGQYIPVAVPDKDMMVAQGAMFRR
jgi:hypothetical protein